ncbi:hypothetical protein ACHAXS_011573 [Conticribra weissflogii]
MNLHRNNILNDDDDNQSHSSTEDLTNFAETLRNAQKFFGEFVKGSNDNNIVYDVDNVGLHQSFRYGGSGSNGGNGGGNGDEEEEGDWNERYAETRRGNLYRCVRSVRHVDSLVAEEEEETDEGVAVHHRHRRRRRHRHRRCNDDDDDEVSMVSEECSAGGSVSEDVDSQMSDEDGDDDDDGPTNGNGVVVDFASLELDDDEHDNDEDDHDDDRNASSYLPAKHRIRPSSDPSAIPPSTASIRRSIFGPIVVSEDDSISKRTASTSGDASDDNASGRRRRRRQGQPPHQRRASWTEFKHSFTKKPSEGSMRDSVDGDSRRGSESTHKGSAIDANSAMQVKTNISITANDTQSFRQLQKKMKMKGAVTESSVRALIRDTVEDHVAENDLDISETTWNGDEADMERGKRPSILAGADAVLNGAVTNGIAQYFRVGTSGAEVGAEDVEQLELKRRLEKDPLFGGCPRPYSSIASHEGHYQIIKDIVGCAIDQGEGCFLSITGDRYTGKSKLVREVLDSVKNEVGMEFCALWSHRSGVDSLTSFYPFREIVSTALRECEARTRRDVTWLHNNHNGHLESDEAIVQQLIRRKIIDKSDQLMIGRILRHVMNAELLSLLKGRNPTVMIKDLAASLLKIMIPLQPVLLVFEAIGDGDDIDSSSFCLMNELLILARSQCPQMLLISIARKEPDIPKGLLAMTVPIHLKRMQKSDMKSFIRSLVCEPGNIDRTMRVDCDVADCVYERTKGCPLFTERVVFWAMRKQIIQLDESRNRVVFHSTHQDEPIDRLGGMLPAQLSEEILELLNNLPHQEMDALKVACCLGTTFRIERFEALKYEGFYESLLAVIASHGIFDKIDVEHYKWKHISVFEAVESIIISNERIEIHGRIADALNPLTVDHVEGDAQFARHYSMADRWTEAYSQYMEAGKKAERNLDFMGAVSLYKQAESCLKRMEGQPSLEQRLSPRIALGLCLRELIRYDDAEIELEYCLNATTTVSEESRASIEFTETYLKVITALATLKQAQSKYPEAIELYDRALPIARENQGLHSQVWLANHVAAYAEILRKSGDVFKAKQLHSEALEYRTTAVEVGACTILELASSYTQLGCTLFGLGDFSQAFNFHKKALVARVEHLDFHHSLVSESLNYCADVLQAMGNGKDGISLGMHAANIRKTAFGTFHPAYAHALSVLGSCYHSIGRSYDALELLEECLDICEVAFSMNHANLIPNLMLYGSILRVTGNLHKSRSVYERALAIHKKNFGDGNEKQRKGIEDLLLDELTLITNPKMKAPLDMAIPTIQVESDKEHLLICADIGSRPSDEYMLSVASSLQQMGILQLVGVICVCPPQVERADMARGAMDSLLLPDVPVAFSGVSIDPINNSSGLIFKSDYGRPSPHVNNSGVELLTRALKSAPNKSLVLMCSSCLGDAAEVIDNNPSLFSRAVKEVIILGSVKPLKRSKYLEPEETGLALWDSYGKKVYRFCQKMKIPTHFSGFPVSLKLCG